MRSRGPRRPAAAQQPAAVPETNGRGARDDRCVRGCLRVRPLRPPFRSKSCRHPAVIQSRCKGCDAPLSTKSHQSVHARRLVRSRIQLRRGSACVNRDMPAWYARTPACRPDVEHGHDECRTRSRIDSLTTGSSRGNNPTGYAGWNCPTLQFLTARPRSQAFCRLSRVSRCYEIFTGRRRYGHLPICRAIRARRLQ